MNRISLAGLLRAAFVVLGGFSLALVVTPVTAPAYAAPRCLEPGKLLAPVPWHQKLLAPERAWPLATGAGVTVAVLDSGVEGRHPQLRGQVSAGADFLNAAKPAAKPAASGRAAPRTSRPNRGDTDCVGHGTAVASLIAARSAEGTGFQGVAPGASILPVVVSEKQGVTDREQGRATPPAEFAKALRWAVAQRARVVNLSVTFYSDHAEVRSAVQFALERDVVVVAAVGNLGGDGNPVPYPAAYPGVIGVGAIGGSGQVLPESGHGSFVDLVAPGDAIVAATLRSGHTTWRGTSFAAPLVAGSAALVRQYWPELDARQVADRLVATASPAPGGRNSPYYGNGVVDPYRAVTERFAPETARRAVDAVRYEPDHAAQQREQRQRQQWRGAVTVAGVGGGATLLVVAGAVALRNGRRRGWRPGRARPLPVAPDVGDAPVRLFDDSS